MEVCGHRRVSWRVSQQDRVGHDFGLPMNEDERQRSQKKKAEVDLWERQRRKSAAR
jgi:hypothetical protein